MIYLISDTHFYDKNIINYCGRPFCTVDGMNKKIIENWNSIVKPEDTVYHLGDVGSGSKENIQHIVKQLHGHKILVKGNHDHHFKNTDWHDIGFEEVYNEGVIYKEFYLLSHKPLFVNSKHSPYVNIHGHIHQNKMGESCYVNVSVEQTNYKPVSIASIIKSFRS